MPNPREDPNKKTTTLITRKELSVVPNRNKDEIVPKSIQKTASRERSILFAREAPKRAEPIIAKKWMSQNHRLRLLSCKFSCNRIRTI